MKMFILLLFTSSALSAQTLQLHYDLRHTIKPGRNPRNFPTIYFEYWKSNDSSSTLVKVQADLLDKNLNMGKAYLQVAKGFYLYKGIQLHLSYSGGLGLTGQREYSYTITNTFQAGLSYPFQWKKAFLSAVLDLKFVPYKRGTADPIFTLYWWRGFNNYKVEFSGDFSIWTENKNHGDEISKTLRGKRFSFFAEPQVWLNINKWLAAGSRLNMYYHVNTNDNSMEIYPTAGLRCKL